MVQVILNTKENKAHLLNCAFVRFLTPTYSCLSFRMNYFPLDIPVFPLDGPVGLKSISDVKKKIKDVGTGCHRSG